MPAVGLPELLEVNHVDSHLIARLDWRSRCQVMELQLRLAERRVAAGVRRERAVVGGGGGAG